MIATRRPKSDRDNTPSDSGSDRTSSNKSFKCELDVHDNAPIATLFMKARTLIWREYQPNKYRPKYNEKEVQALMQALNRFENYLVLEYQAIENKFKNTNIDITTHPSYEQLVIKSSAIYLLAEGITGDKSYNEKLAAIDQFRAKIGWLTFAKEAVKRACFVVIGAALGFVCGYLTMGAGALLGNAVYRHGLFKVAPSFVGKQYGLVHLAQAFVDNQDKEPGVVGVIRRLAHKL